MDSKFHEELTRTSNALLALEEQLHQLADALELIGNPTLAERLGNIALNISDARANIATGITTFLDRELRKMRESFASTMEAAIQSAEKRDARIVEEVTR